MKQIFARFLLCCFGVVALAFFGLVCREEPVVGAVIILPALFMWAVYNA